MKTFRERVEAALAAIASKVHNPNPELRTKLREAEHARDEYMAKLNEATEERDELLERLERLAGTMPAEPVAEAETVSTTVTTETTETTEEMVDDGMMNDGEEPPAPSEG